MIQKTDLLEKNTNFTHSLKRKLEKRIATSTRNRKFYSISNSLKDTRDKHVLLEFQETQDHWKFLWSIERSARSPRQTDDRVSPSPLLLCQRWMLAERGEELCKRKFIAGVTVETKRDETKFSCWIVLAARNFELFTFVSGFTGNEVPVEIFPRKCFSFLRVSGGIGLSRWQTEEQKLNVDRQS